MRQELAYGVQEVPLVFSLKMTGQSVGASSRLPFLAFLGKDRHSKGNQLARASSIYLKAYNYMTYG
jgi:hypothetical protein